VSAPAIGTLKAAAADPGVPRCQACGSAAFQDLTPPGACGVLRLLKCLRCGRQWLVAGDKISA
jgi:hypothetical protein